MPAKVLAFSSVSSRRKPSARPAVGTLTAKPPQPCEADSLATLVAAAKGGDRAALDRLLAVVRSRFMGLALRVLGDADEAEDAMQEALLKVWRYIGRFEGRSSPSTWLHRLVVNAALDRRRRRTAGVHEPAGERAAIELETAPAGDDPERSFARAETAHVVRGALGRLSLAHADAVRLYDLEGESYASVAETVDCPIGTVMSRLYHARRKLAQELTLTATNPTDLEALRAA